MSAHAQLSPSSAVRWMSCPGSVALCADLPDTSRSHADEGTAAHEMAEMVLTGAHDTCAKLIGSKAENGVTFTAEMADFVQDYVNYVRDLAYATGGELLVEQRLSIESLTGEPDAHGTSDVVILAGTELSIVDLKYGRGVPVVADDNPQLQIYGLAALREYGLAADFATVRMVIHQPRLGVVSEWVQTTDQMEDFAEQVSEAAEFTRRADAPLNPTEKGCKWCKAKGTCRALAEEVQAAVGADFDDLTSNEPMQQDTHPALLTPEELGKAMAATDLIEIWIKAVRAETEAKLLAGVQIQGWKLVQGKKGNRAWTDKAAAEELLKSMRVKHDQMYDYSVISPTSAEKLAKSEVIGPRQWPKVQALITQSEGRPSVAPESDKRPALVMSATADDFEDVTQGEAEACDLA